MVAPRWAFDLASECIKWSDNIAWLRHQTIANQWQYIESNNHSNTANWLFHWTTFSANVYLSFLTRKCWFSIKLSIFHLIRIKLIDMYLEYLDNSQALTLD